MKKRRETVYADFIPIQSVEILGDSVYGNWICWGCGIFEFDGLEISRTMDLHSVRPEDMGHFLEETQNGTAY